MLSLLGSHHVVFLFSLVSSITFVMVLAFPLRSLSGSIFPHTSLYHHRLLSAIHKIALEICGKDNTNATPPKYPKNAEGIYGMIFQELSSPALMQRIAGKRVTSTDLRTELICELLVRSVAETCANRRTYIGRILDLPKPVQEMLRIVIERSIKASTPQKKQQKPSVRQQSPQIHEPSTPIVNMSATKTTPSGGVHSRTPKSSGSRRRTSIDTIGSPGGISTAGVGLTPSRPIRNSRTLAITPMLKKRFGPGPSIQSDPSVDPRAKTDLLALLAWVKTFPEFLDRKESMETNSTDVLCQQDVAR